MGHVRTYAEAVEELAKHDLIPDHNGFTLSHLMSYAAEQGWSVTTEQTSAKAVGRRWRASVTTHLPPNGYIIGAQGSGATEEEALAVAMAGILRRTA